jgi:outer membrane protein TolC
MKKILFVICTICITHIAKGQATNMTVNDCIKYAIANQNKLKIATIDEAIQKAKNSQIASAIYPTVSANGSLSYFPIVPKQRSRADLFSFGSLFDAFLPSAFDPNYVAPPAQEYNALQFALPINNSLTVQATQIIFSSDVLVALKARATMESLTKLNTQRTLEQLKVDISKAYYNCSIAQKRSKLLDDNIELIAGFEKNVQGLYKEGFAEKIDADKLTVQRNNLETEKEKIASLIQLSTQLLKFQMGMPLGQQIVLTDEVSYEELNKNMLVEEAPQYDNRIEMQLMKTAKMLNEFNMTRVKKSNLPTVVAVANLGLASQMKRFKELVTLPYYPSSTIALSASVGLFDGGKRKHTLEEIKLTLQKADIEMASFRDVVDLETTSAKTTLRNNLKSLKTQEINIKLAEKVYNIAQKKSKEGVGSTIEVLQTQTALKEAQTNYLSALYDATISKIDLQKALGLLK